MLQLAAAMMLFAAATPAPQRTRARKHPAPKKVVKPAPPPQLPCGDVLAFQVLLDRQGFSPGQIDGKTGANFTHALTALQAARDLPSTGEPDCDTWHALGGDQAGEMTATYAISDQDLKGPFEEQIPADMMRQAKLPHLSYRSPLEALSERFHAAPALLQHMNSGVPFTAGTSIRVPGVQPFDISAKPAADPAAAENSVTVSKAESALRVVRADGSLIFFAPVTTGSEHDPLPVGDWKVTSVRWMPDFHYNPKLFWDAKPQDNRATIKPGPNNPVGVVWIDLNLPHYGLHGTPEPGNVGHTESHGCVRLTNWDAARVASLVKNGTPVQFR